MKIRKNHSREFKPRVALEAIREEIMLAELSRKCGLAPVTSRSPDSFMRPFARMPRGFCHPAKGSVGARTVTEVFDAIDEICDLYNLAECWNHFKAAGFASS